MSASNSTIAEYLGVDGKQIIGRRDLADSVVVLVNEGIGGVKKHTIPFDALFVPVKIKKIEPAPAPKEPEQEAPAVDYAGLTVTELKAIASERGIAYTGLRKAELIEALEVD